MTKNKYDNKRHKKCRKDIYPAFFAVNLKWFQNVEIDPEQGQADGACDENLKKCIGSKSQDG